MPRLGGLEASLANLCVPVPLSFAGLRAGRHAPHFSLEGIEVLGQPLCPSSRFGFIGFSLVLSHQPVSLAWEACRPCSVIFGGAPKRLIGGSGLPALQLMTLPETSDRPSFDAACWVLLSLCGFLVPLSRACFVLVFLGLGGLISNKLPGNFSPLGRLLRLPFSGVEPTFLLPLGQVGKPDAPILRQVPSRGRVANPPTSWFARFLWLLGIGHWGSLWTTLYCLFCASAYDTPAVGFGVCRGESA